MHVQILLEFFVASKLHTCFVYRIPYSGKFSRVLIFAVFADQDESAKFYTSKISRYTV